MNKTNFLFHIGGLRGIAIILVILFHLCPDVFPYCYYGVDIFLVITGYLLFRGAKHNTGTLKENGYFALKKAKRILPSLTIVILLTILFGFYFLDKTLLEATARLGRYALFGLSNLHLNKVIADYFDTTAAQNPLLHTWYIGVTLQVYLAFALGAILFKRCTRKSLLTILFTIGALSLLWKYRMNIQSILVAWNLLPITDAISAPTHYETLPRLWEILAGGLILLLPSANNKYLSSLLTISGLLCISTAFFLPHAEIITVIGTMLIIAYAGESKTNCLLSNRVLLGIGAISYSLYLIHMPVFTFYKSWIVIPPTSAEYAAMLCITAVLGWILWKLAETRNFKTITWTTLWGVTMLLCVLTKKTTIISDWISGASEEVIVKSYEHWQWSDDEQLQRGYDTSRLNYWGGMFSMSDTCAPAQTPKFPLFHIGDKQAQPNFVLMGDSHAGSMYAGFDDICRKQGCAGIYLPSIISPFWNYEVQMDEEYKCSRDKILALLSWLENQPQIKHIVIVQRWYQRCRVNKYDWDKQPADTSIAAHTEALRTFLKRMQAIGKHTILVDQIPDFETNPRTYGKWCIRHGRNPNDFLTPFQCPKERYESRHADFLKMLSVMQQENLCSVLSFKRALNENGSYVSYADGEVLYRDDNHPATPGAIYLMNKLAPDFFELLTR